MCGQSGSNEPGISGSQGKHPNHWATQKYEELLGAFDIRWMDQGTNPYSANSNCGSGTISGGSVAQWLGRLP